MHGFKELVKDVRQHFGQDIVAKCVTHDFLDITRLIRNALVHNGGRQTPELKAKQHGIRVENGILQIMAPDNDILMRALEGRTLLIVESPRTLPQFQINGGGQ